MRRLLAVVITAVTLVIAGCNLSTEPLPPTPTPPPLPTVFFNFPQNGSRVVEGTDMDIELVARDEELGIIRVELYVDDVLINERGPEGDQPVEVFTVLMNWLAQGVGRHTLSAQAYRADEVASDPTTIVVEVVADDAVTPEVTVAP